MEKGSCILSATTRLVWHDYAGPGARAPDPIQPPHFFVHPHSILLFFILPLYRILISIRMSFLFICFLLFL